MLRAQLPHKQVTDGDWCKSTSLLGRCERMRWRLRYLQHDLELSEGQFAVGRNATCQLSLDDPLVSRRHALLIVAKDGVTIEDLQSRNGVIVNGQRIAS